jgi:hypothetical protein
LVFVQFVRQNQFVYWFSPGLGCQLQIDHNYLSIRWYCVEDNPALQASVSRKIPVWNVLVCVWLYGNTHYSGDKLGKKAIWVNMVFHSAKTFQVLSWHFYCVAGAICILCNSTFIIDWLESKIWSFHSEWILWYLLVLSTILLWIYKRKCTLLLDSSLCHTYVYICMWSICIFVHSSLS